MASWYSLFARLDIGKARLKFSAAWFIVSRSFFIILRVKVGLKSPFIILGPLFTLIPVLKYVEFKISRKISGSRPAPLTRVILSDRDKARMEICRFIASFIA